MGQSIAQEGSSPLTRGKRTPFARSRSRRGLIPAHAGKTPSIIVSKNYNGAHPRSRGENSHPAKLPSLWAGSSPLTRGKRNASMTRTNGPGLIPAHAGKTRMIWISEHTSWAHPRSRGENPESSVQVLEELGSSPLTRGKRGRSAAPARRRGLIPAHAGKTLPDLRFYRADRSDLGKP